MDKTIISMLFLEKFNSGEWAQKVYFWTRMAVYTLALIGGVFFAFLILFPTGYFQFSFLNPSSTKNTVGSPRLFDQSFPSKGNIKSGEKFFFDASILGNFSQAQISLTLDKSSAEIKKGNVEIHKSYQAFLYPEGYPFGFKDGTLLKNSGNYFIVSSGQLRPFSSSKLVSSMGWREDSFWEAAAEDLSYNPVGDTIEASRQYPEDSLFKIQDAYYILKNNQLEKFVSAQAFQSQYSPSQVIYRNGDFFDQYPKSQEIIGFSDGSLISYGDAVFIVSGKNIFPIGDANIFSSLGYNWDDVIKVGADELSLYEKAKMLDLRAVHPDGTIFVTREKAEYYMVGENQKHHLPSFLVVKSWIKKNPVIVSKSSLDNSVSCSLEKNIFSFGNVFSCETSIESLGGELGKDFEFQFNSDAPVKLENINIKMKKIVDMANFQRAMTELLGRIKRNYVQEN